MRMSSMDILLHRYFDGDLTPEESEAFLHDVASNPALMERMELEAQFNRALIDDAYSLEPPDSVRAAVLDTVLVSQRSSFSTYAWFRGAITAFLMMFSVVVPTSSPVWKYMASLYTPHMVPAETVTSRVESQTPPLGKDTFVSQEARGQHVMMDDSTEPTMDVAYNAPSSSFIRPLSAPVISIMSLGNMKEINGLSEITSSAPSSFRMLDGVGGFVSPTTISLRLSVEASERLSLFTEIGTTQLTQQVTQYENNVRQQTLQNSSGAFVAVGVAYNIPLRFLGERSVSASAAIAISRAGAFGFVDLSVDVISVQSLYLQAGARMSGGPDLERNVEPMLMLRVRL